MFEFFELVFLANQILALEDDKNPRDRFLLLNAKFLITTSTRTFFPSDYSFVVI